MRFATEASPSAAQLAAPALNPPSGAAGRPLLHQLPPGAALPAWCDRHLSPPAQDALGGRAWYDATLSTGMPPGGEALLALGAEESVLFPLMRLGGRLRSLTTPYSLGWRPLPAGSGDPAKPGPG